MAAPIMWTFGSRGRRKQFEQAVAAHFDFLRELDYSAPQFTTDWDTLLGERHTAVMRSSSREITITVSNPQDKHPFILLHLNRQPRTSVDDDFELTLFLRNRRPDLAHSIERIEQASETFETFLEAVLPIYALALTNDARDIATGKSWESGFYGD